MFFHVVILCVNIKLHSVLLLCIQFVIQKGMMEHMRWFQQHRDFQAAIMETAVIEELIFKGRVVLTVRIRYNMKVSFNQISLLLHTTCMHNELSVIPSSLLSPRIKYVSKKDFPDRSV